MKKNMSQLDSVVRITIGIVILFIGSFEIIPFTWMLILGAVAVIFLFSGVSNFCPLYKVLGVKTRKTDNASLDSEG